MVIELLGGDEPARTLTSKALRLGRHVVTANKSYLPIIRNTATAGVEQWRDAEVQRGCRWCVPALETVSRARRLGPLHSISGVLNGTTNFILDRLANGLISTTPYLLHRRMAMLSAIHSLI